jgi:hypothetical protein
MSPSEPRDLFLQRTGVRCIISGDCLMRPTWVGIASSTDCAELVPIWACDDHLYDLFEILRERGVDPEDATFAVPPTCSVMGRHHTPCGGAADHILISDAIQTVRTVCPRHLNEHKPRLRHAHLW